MPDPSQREDLQRTLVELHGQLDDAADVNDELRELLQTAASDINRVLDQEGDGEHLVPAVDRSREAALQFEGRHPVLSQMIEQITTTLANMGL